MGAGSRAGNAERVAKCLLDVQPECARQMTYRHQHACRCMRETHPHPHPLVRVGVETEMGGRWAEVLEGSMVLEKTLAACVPEHLHDIDDTLEKIKKEFIGHTHQKMCPKSEPTLPIRS